jgi:hypothetical protein
MDDETQKLLLEQENAVRAKRIQQAEERQQKLNGEIHYQVEHGRPFFPKHFFKQHFRSEPAEFLAFGGKKGKFPWNYLYKNGRKFRDIESAIKFLGNPGGKIIVPEGYFPRTTPVILRKYQKVEGPALGHAPPPLPNIPDAPPAQL